MPRLHEWSTLSLLMLQEPWMLLFSGEPDPEWQITPSNPNHQKIKRLLDSARKDGFSYGEEKIPMELGFKGFLVKTVSTASRKAELILGQDTVELQKLFLQTMPKNEESKGIRDYVLTVIKHADPFTKATKKMNGAGFGVGPPTWSTQSLESWSAPGVVDTNNCYNYATNVKSTSGKVANPGRGGGNEIERPYTAEQVRLAAELDGLLTVSKQDEPPIGFPFVVPNSHFTKSGEQRYLVALFVKDVPEAFGNYLLVAEQCRTRCVCNCKKGRRKKRR